MLVAGHSQTSERETLTRLAKLLPAPMGSTSCKSVLGTRAAVAKLPACESSAPQDSGIDAVLPDVLNTSCSDQQQTAGTALCSLPSDEFTILAALCGTAIFKPSYVLCLSEWGTGAHLSRGRWPQEHLLSGRVKPSCACKQECRAVRGISGLRAPQDDICPRKPPTTTNCTITVPRAAVEQAPHSQTYLGQFVVLQQHQHYYDSLLHLLASRCQKNNYRYESRCAHYPPRVHLSDPKLYPGYTGTEGRRDQQIATNSEIYRSPAVNRAARSSG